MEALFSRLLVYLARSESLVACFTRRQSALLSAVLVVEVARQEYTPAISQDYSREDFLEVPALTQHSEFASHSVMLCILPAPRHSTLSPVWRAHLFHTLPAKSKKVRLTASGGCESATTDLQRACRPRHSIQLLMSSGLRSSGHTTASDIAGEHLLTTSWP